MNRRVFAFTTVWIFAFSMFSNCYCNPSMKEKAPMPCHQQANQDCAPRYQTDDVESISTFTAFNQFSTKLIVPVENSNLVVTDKTPTKDWVSFASPPPPVLYLLHHSFLI